MNVEAEILALKKQLASWNHANRSGQFQRANNLRGSQVSHSQLIGAFHPVLGDFGNVSTYELQAPAKAQLGLSIVPNGKVSDGASVFGLLNQIFMGVPSAGLLTAGFNTTPPPPIVLLVTTLNPAASMVIWNTDPTYYAVQFGPGSQSHTSGVGGIQIGGDTSRLWAAERTPANSAATGYLGEVCFDDNYVYVYTTAGWKRSGLTAF